MDKLSILNISQDEKIAYIARNALPGPRSVQDVEDEIKDVIYHSIFGWFVGYDELVDMVYCRVTLRVGMLN